MTSKSSQVMLIAAALCVAAGMTGAGLAADRVANAEETDTVKATAAETKKIVFLAGRPSHGWGAHEHYAGCKLLADALDASGLPVETVVYKHQWPDNPQEALADADAIIMYTDGGARHPVIKHQDEYDKLISSGVGLMCLHFGVEVPKGPTGEHFRKWIGGYYETAWSCNPMWDLESELKKDHPVTRGVKSFKVHDEWYFNMRFTDDRSKVIDLLQGTPGQKVRNGPYVYPRGPYEHIQKGSGPETVMWGIERADGGRGVGFTGGHYHHNWADDGQRKIVLNAIAWIAKVEVPENGVESKTPTEADLEANQDFPKPEKRKKSGLAPKRDVRAAAAASATRVPIAIEYLTLVYDQPAQGPCPCGRH